MQANAYAAKAAKQSLEPYRFELADLGPEEVDVQVTHCGICHTDVALVEDEWGMTQYPWFPGMRSSEQSPPNWQFAHPLPEEIASESSGPLLCAGTTVFAPLLRSNVRPTDRRLPISSTYRKDEQAHGFGARHFIATRGTDELAKAASSFDFICRLSSPTFPGTLPCCATASGQTLHCRYSAQGNLFLSLEHHCGRKVGRWRATGFDRRDLQDARLHTLHGIKPKAETFPMAEANAALNHTRKSHARFRFVLIA